MFFLRRQNRSNTERGVKAAKRVEEPKRFFTIGGVYYEDDETSSKPCSMTSLDTTSTGSSDDSHSIQSNWISSGSPDYHHGAPKIARNFSRRRVNPNNLELTESELIGRIMLHSRRLPKDNGYLVSNHVMINNERIVRSTAPLTRSPAMDELARNHAKKMAEESQLFHSDRQVLYENLAGEDKTERIRIGENVTRGESLAVIHRLMMQSLPDKNNILDRRYTHMGVGTAKGHDGTLYLCQIFRD